LFPDVFNSIRTLGLRKSALIIIGIFKNLLFDLKHGLDTKPHRDQVTAYKKGLKLAQTVHGSRYSDTSLLALRDLFSALDLNSDNILLDVGCGKGLVLLTALEFNFKEIRGFDHSQYLCDIAINNCLKYQKKLGTNTTVKINGVSAIDYQFQDDENVLYLYNPFDDYISEKFLEIVESSLNRNKRKMLIITHRWPGIELLKERFKPTTEKRYTFWGKCFNVFQI
jgi:SAM-dependent methyltransferase